MPNLAGMTLNFHNKIISYHFSAHYDPPDGLNHAKPHVDTVGGMFVCRRRQPGHTVVTVTQDLDPHAVVLLWIQNTEFKLHTLQLN